MNTFTIPAFVLISFAVFLAGFIVGVWLILKKIK